MQKRNKSYFPGTNWKSPDDIRRNAKSHTNTPINFNIKTSPSKHERAYSCLRFHVIGYDCIEKLLWSNKVTLKTCVSKWCYSVTKCLPLPFITLFMLINRNLCPCNVVQFSSSTKTEHWNLHKEGFTWSSFILVERNKLKTENMIIYRSNIWCPGLVTHCKQTAR